MSNASIMQSVLYRIMYDSDFNKQFKKDPVNTLNRAGITDERQQFELFSYLNSNQFVLVDSFRETMNLATRFKTSVKASLDQIESGYRGAMWMYWFAFLTGILMIIAAILFAIYKKENLLSIVFGSLGTLDLLVFFIMKPPMELQNSRIGFARLEAAFMNWFIEMTNLNSLYQQMAGSFGIGFSDPNGIPIQVSPEIFERYMNKFMEVSKRSMDNTQTTLEMMGKIIREEKHQTDKTQKEE